MFCLEFMPLGLRYRINEGISVTEGRMSIDIIVRGITLSLEGLEVDFEFRDLEGSKKFLLTENQTYDVTRNCKLHLPGNTVGKNLEQMTVYFFLDATKKVEFGKKKIYD